MSRRVAGLLSGLVLAVALAATGAFALSGGGAAPRPAASPRTATVVTSASPTPSPSHTATARPSRVARPVRVQIPKIGVNAPLISLGLDKAGALEVPTRFDVAGWWTGGSRPGERGPAVIAGHVDSKSGPAVFYEIGQLRRGDTVTVRRSDGTSVRFTVQSIGHYSKDHFPTSRVYGKTSRPTLRLITCSGTFDRSTGHYLDNTVVFAAA